MPEQGAFRLLGEIRNLPGKDSTPVLALGRARSAIEAARTEENGGAHFDGFEEKFHHAAVLRWIAAMLGGTDEAEPQVELSQAALLEA